MDESNVTQIVLAFMAPKELPQEKTGVYVVSVSHQEVHIVTKLV